MGLGQVPQSSIRSCSSDMMLDYVRIGMHTNISGEDCSFKRVSVTQEWGLDVKVVTPLSFLSKISVPCVHVDPGGIFQASYEGMGIRICVGGEDCSFKPVYIEMEGAESLASDLLDSLEAYQGGLGVLEGAESCVN
ncbi:hypothetical protein Tco_0897709 [Tanacetum coccineum]